MPGAGSSSCRRAEQRSQELIEAAQIDGSNAFQTALRIKLPLIRKWVVYMLVLSFASGTQLFVEPQILGIATGGEVPPQWSPNQLAYYLAFQLDRFNEATAISVDLLVFGLLVAVLIVWRGKLFEVVVFPGHYALRLLAILILLLFAAFFFGPIIWLLLAPTKTNRGSSIRRRSPSAASATFGHTFSGLHHLRGRPRPDLAQELPPSTLLAGLRLAVLTAIPAGYGLALTHFVGRRALRGITLVVMIVPATALVLPLFLEANTVHLVGTVWSLILPFGFFPFGVYLAYIYFSTTIPKDQIGAAHIDGAGEWGVFRRIALPLATPIVGLVGFFSFVANWNNYYLPFVMTYDNSQYPLQVGLPILLGSSPSINPVAATGGQAVIYRPEVAMATIVAIAPVLIVFLFAQRTLVAGMLAGSTKE